MNRLTKIILLLAGLTFCLAGCDVLLPSDWGTSGKPCNNDGDCAGGFDCDMNHSKNSMCVPGIEPECDDDFDCFNNLDIYSAYCASGHCKPWDADTGFGDDCDQNEDCDSGLELNHCVCFWESNDCFCTKECGSDDECSYPGDARCMNTGVVATPKACGRAAFSEGNGILCPNGISDCEAIDTKCGNFPFQDTNICGTTCSSKDDCPYGESQECGPLGAVTICGHPDWFGWYVDCSTGGNTVCDVPGSLYTHCREDRCTHTCASDDDCPTIGNCHIDGFCVLD
ncbi:MAG: hypothetical protein JRJ87_04945 [Deltaproteobacteria bacterium]|nr:hypothetical protein [Deltaproteobacteria bacterium]